MIALEHLQTNALLIVLFGALLTLFTLRVAVYLSQRARVARDLAIIDSLTISTTRVSGSNGNGLNITPHAEPIARGSHSDSLNHADSLDHADSLRGHAIASSSTLDVSAARPHVSAADSAAVVDADHDARSDRAHPDLLH